MFATLSLKQKIVFFIIIGIMLLFIFYYLYTTFYQNSFSFENTATYSMDDILIPSSNETEISFEQLEDNEIIVYICGAVKENKVIALKEKSRIADAIDAVGGLTANADITHVNLAYILEDGEKVYIPQKGESIENEPIVSNSMTSTTESSIPKSKININKVGQAELEGIPGIGPSTALKIIQYRKEHGNFSSIEDIKNVSGIGDGKYEKMKSYITTK